MGNKYAVSGDALIRYSKTIARLLTRRNECNPALERSTLHKRLCEKVKLWTGIEMATARSIIHTSIPRKLNAALDC
jgi:hypothetical protein